MFDRSLNRIKERLNRTLARNQLLQKVTDQAQQRLQVSRVVIYYFYREWKGQVIVESLSHSYFSILGSTGADDCFNDDYAGRYLAGRTLAVDDIDQSHFESCHLAFLRSINVKADLVVPIVIDGRLWGLLAAHHHRVRSWSAADLAFLQQQAQVLAVDPVLLDFKL